METNQIIELSHSIPEYQEAFFWFIPVIVAAAVATTVIIIALITTSGKTLAIIGMQMAGKTTMWNMLRNGYSDKNYSPTGKEQVGEFVLKNGDRQIKIKKSLDVGGGDEYLKLYWNQLIKENEIIIFIFNIQKYLNDLEYQRQTNARLDFICEKASESNREMKNMVMIASHIDLFPSGEQKDADQKVLRAMTGKSYEKMFKENYCAINLTDKPSIDKLVNEIFN